MTAIISCDWGTSVLRVRVVDTNATKVLAEVTSDNGIANTFGLWKRTNDTEANRVAFYQAVLNKQIKRLEEQLNISLNDLPVVISGMASSNMGMVELPYKELPLNVYNPDLNVRLIEATDQFKYLIWMIPGVKSGDDVMRGEETQLIGCMEEENRREQLFIFPGTHSKHVTVKNGACTDFKTFMTGEFFDLLSSKSILSGSVEPSGDLKDEENRKAFKEGLEASDRSNLLHNSFLVRTNDLFKKLTPIQNYHYLSGLVIGEEIRELMIPDTRISLVASGKLGELYSIALRTKLNNSFELRIEDPDLSLIQGQLKIVSGMRGME